MKADQTLQQAIFTQDMKDRLQRARNELYRIEFGLDDVYKEHPEYGSILAMTNRLACEIIAVEAKILCRLGCRGDGTQNKADDEADQVFLAEETIPLGRTSE